MVRRFLRHFVLGVVAVSTASCGQGEEWQDSTYRALSTFEYVAPSGESFFAQATGTIVVSRTARDADRTFYSYGLASEVGLAGGRVGAELESPPFVMQCDPSAARFVGSDPVLEQIGLLGNRCLDQVKSKIHLDGRKRECSFHFTVNRLFPENLIYELTGVEKQSDVLGGLAVVFARSAPFGLRGVPGVRCEYRLVLVLDREKDRLLFQASHFEIRTQEKPGNACRKPGVEIETLMVACDGEEPVDLRSLGSVLDAAHLGSRVGLSNYAPPDRCSIGPNRLMLHASAVRDMAELSACAAVAGRPNFAMAATVGLALLVDSGVSTATRLAHEAGLIDWKWKGLPNYIGRGVGLGAARIVRAVSRRAAEAEEELWRKIGGLGPAAAALFVPGEMGAQIGSGGIELLKGVKRGRKSIRISRAGASLLKARKGWIGSAEADRQLQLALRAARLGRRAVEAELAAEQRSVRGGRGSRGSETARARRRQRLQASVGPREQQLLVALRDRIAWQRFFRGMREAEAKRLGKRLWSVLASKNPGFEYVDTQRFECGGQAHWIVIVRDERTGLEFSLIPGGRFRMGSAEGEAGRDEDESPVHEVHLAPFLMCRTECTQRAWDRVGGSDDRGYKGPDLPIVDVDWNDCVAWCEKAKLRLPSEAEWEYACRAGTATRFCFGDSDAAVAGYAWYEDNSGGRPHPVGRKAPNAFGLYDVHGNVFEWCRDRYHENYLGAPADGSAWEEGSSSERVARGGDFYNSLDWGRSAARSRDEYGAWNDNTGFRPACSVALP